MNSIDAVPLVCSLNYLILFNITLPHRNLRDRQPKLTPIRVVFRSRWDPPLWNYLHFLETCDVLANICDDVPKELHIEEGLDLVDVRM
jgi:hypothetical protein